MSAAVGGNTSSTKMNIAFSGASLIRLRMTYTNCPTVRSYVAWVKDIGQASTVHDKRRDASEFQRTDGTRYFFLSMVGISVRSAFSQITCSWIDATWLIERIGWMGTTLTGIRSGYFCLIRSASALRFSAGRLQNERSVYGLTAEPLLTKRMFILELGPHCSEITGRGLCEK